MSLQRGQVLQLFKNEYVKQIRNRGVSIEQLDRDKVLINSMFLEIPDREDGSLRATLVWAGERVAEVYHKGNYTIIVGFYPQK